jgi:hypothetical protein
MYSDILVNYIFFKYFFNKYEFIVFLNPYVNFFVSFISFFWENTFFFVQVFQVFLGEWAFLSYNYDHSIIIYMCFYLFLCLTLKNNLYFNMFYLIAFFFLGFILGGQWAFFSIRWGFFWNRDFIEIVELIIICNCVYYCHMKSIYYIKLGIMYHILYCLVIIFLIKCGFFMSNHSFFNLLLVNHFCLIRLVYITLLLYNSINCLMLKFLFFIIIKLLNFFYNLNHKVIFWFFFSFLKWFYLNNRLVCFLLDEHVSINFFYTSQIVTHIYIFVYNSFVYDFCFNIDGPDFFLENLLYNITKYCCYFFFCTLYVLLLFF